MKEVATLRITNEIYNKYVDTVIETQDVQPNILRAIGAQIQQVGDQPKDQRLVLTADSKIVEKMYDL